MSDAVGSSELSHLLDLLYRGVEEYALWQEFLERFNELCESRDASLMMVNPGLDTVLYILYTDSRPEISSQYIDGSLRAAAFINEVPCPVPSTITELISEERYLNSVLYREYFQPVGVRHMLVQDIRRTGDFVMRLTVKRSDDQPPFSEREKRIFDLIVPHLRRALTLRSHHYENQYRRTLFEDTINRMQVGYILLDSKRRIVELNEVAQAFLEDRVGLASSRGFLRLADDARSEEFDSLLAALINEEDTCLPVDRTLGCRIDNELGEPLLNLAMRPIRKIQQIVHGPVVLLYLCDFSPEPRLIEADLLREIFGFTRSEAKLAALLAMGESSADAAEKLYVSINTVRTHLRGIYQKVGTHKQYKLVSILNRSVARFL
tara:strand:- start:15496 stop:16626 length:1131 start_codon:yes stop_codon:yes gene_type:complete